MDPRVSTAPAPQSKKWVSATSGASLRQPPRKSVHDVPELAERPQTCPAPTLTPQFHWNLNNSALKTLSDDQIQQIYGLFQFYDSSTIGDDLPSINCPRLVEILRDARLLSENITNSSTNNRLQVDAVERIFAQAIMGKMRVYLDADEQPALTFPLFCGALMNCAMLLTPMAHPEAALRQILPILLEGPTMNGHHVTGTKGLLSHLPTDGSISLWIPGQSHGLNQQTDSQRDFRELPPFQQVIADCTRDKDLEEVKQEKLARHYQIPDRLVASFHPDTLALISNKFRMFDVFDRGTLPRQEMFPLLSSLGRHADLPDPYAVLTTLSASNSKTQGSRGVSNAGDMTLADLLQTIEATRQSKQYSIRSQFGAMKVNSTRVDPKPSAALDEKTEPMSSLQEVDMDDSNNTDHAASSHNSTSRRHGSKDRGKKSRKSMVSKGPVAANSTHSLLNSKHRIGSKAVLTHHASVSGKKKAELHRKPTSKLNSKQAARHRDSMQSSSPGNYTHRSGTTIFSNNSNSDDEHAVVEVLDSLSSRSGGTNHECTRQGSPTIHREFANLNNETQPQILSNASTGQVHEPSTSSNQKMLQIFLLLGGDHDGAICCTISLSLTTKQITESEGVYYSNAPCETTRTSPVPPTQHSLMNALFMLKKCVQSKQVQGFELRPANQLEAVENLLQEQTNKQPRYNIARSPTLSPLRDTATANINLRLKALPTPFRESREQQPIVLNSVANSLSASSSSPGLMQTSALSAATSEPVCSAGASPLRRKIASPYSKPVHQRQVDLPNNYRELFALWDVAPNDAWIHDVNAASPLRLFSPIRSQPKSSHVGRLSPLRFSSRHGN